MSSDTTKEFSLWALSRMGFRVEANGSGDYTIFAPPEEPEKFQGAGFVRFHFDSSSALTQSPGIEHLAPGTRMFKWLLGELRSRGEVLHAVPANQPENVHELSDRLFEAYELEGDGKVRLAGCNLEDRPILRLTYVRSTGAALFHCYLDEDCEFVEADFVQSMNLRELASLPDTSPVRKTDDELARWREEGHAKVIRAVSEGDGELGELDPESTPELIVGTIIWCRRASGKLAFDFGELSAEVAFDGWASHFASGAELPPPYTCPESGEQSYTLCVSGDQITVPSALAECEETGQRVSADELQTCAVSDKQVVPSELSTCPVTETQVLTRLLQTCALCGQPVSPTCIQNSRCSACRSLKRVTKEDAQIACLLDKYPQLARWPKWSVAENTQSVVLLASKWTRQLLLVIDKETLEVKRLATSSRLRGQWNVVPESKYAEML